jgi:hypothetical protein
MGNVKGKWWISPQEEIIFSRKGKGGWGEVFLKFETEKKLVENKRRKGFFWRLVKKFFGPFCSIKNGNSQFQSKWGRKSPINFGDSPKSTV